MTSTNVSNLEKICIKEQIRKNNWSNYYQQSQHLIFNNDQQEKCKINLPTSLEMLNETDINHVSEHAPLLLSKSIKYSTISNSTDHESNFSSTVSNNSKSSKKSPKKVDICFSVYLMFYLLYLLIGSFVFERMEREPELTLRQDFRQTRQRFLQKYDNIIGTYQHKHIF